MAAEVVDVHRKKRWIPSNVTEYNILTNCIEAEIGSKLLFYVEKEKAKYYDCNDLLSEISATGFPIASQELMKAGDCYALDQNTACVYHCMRALEIGLRALAADVGVVWSVQQWHVVINEVEKAIKNIGNSLPAGQAKSERMQFLSEAAKEFAWFKDGWRNYAAHAHASYDSARARKVLEHVCAFFDVISLHLTEERV